MVAPVDPLSARRGPVRLFINPITERMLCCAVGQKSSDLSTEETRFAALLRDRLSEDLPNRRSSPAGCDHPGRDTYHRDGSKVEIAVP